MEPVEIADCPSTPANHRAIAFAKAAAVCGLLLAFFGIGRTTGFEAGVKHERRYNVTWMANPDAARFEVLTRGGILRETPTADGWLAAVSVGGQNFTALRTDQTEAIYAAVAKWKGL